MCDGILIIYNISDELEKNINSCINDRSCLNISATNKDKTICYEGIAYITKELVDEESLIYPTSTPIKEYECIFAFDKKDDYESAKESFLAAKRMDTTFNYFNKFSFVGETVITGMDLTLFDN